MDSKAIYDKFRYQLTNVHALTVLTVSLFEIIGYIILVKSGVEFFSLSNAYLWYGVVLPIVTNLINHCVARIIIHKTDASRQAKNTSIIIAALVTTFLVSVIHREYIVTGCAFIFPIILSAMFNDRKLLNISFIGSFIVLLSVGIAFWVSHQITLVTSINLFVLFGFLFISFLCGILSINYSNQNYSAIVSQAEENYKLLQDVMRDQMTGLYNHSTFVTHLKNHINNYENAPFCLVMVDVDDFKRINDTYGHDHGDTVLIQLAKTIQAHCGEEDDAYRYGGEEFAIVFAGKDAGQAQQITQNILAQFRSHTFPFTDKTITFSAGVAQYTAGTSRDAFFEQADKTLYKAKHEGKNQVLIAQ